MTVSILALGFVIGLRHALEADHLAAVSALISRRQSLQQMTLQGAIWGFGHLIALLVVSVLTLFSPWQPPGLLQPIAEVVVGLLLIALGGRVLYLLWRDRVHVHAHRHDGGEIHLHAHSHRGDDALHPASRHGHEHSAFGWRALLLGLAHGVAGSAALTVFVAASLETPGVGLAYVLLFGLGSIAGMVLLTAVIALPLAATATGLTWANRLLQLAVGIASVLIGLRLALAQSGLF